jgi:hypothetical protein
MSFILRAFFKNLASQGYLFFPCFSNAFGLGANKEDLLLIIHSIVSLLSFEQNSSISRLFQHVMFCLIRFHVDVLTLLKSLLIKEHMPMQKLMHKIWCDVF